MSRRLPVYILIDTSGSMKGEPIESVKVGLQAMLSSLRQDPFALESAAISIITYDRDVNILVPLTMLDELQLPEIVAPESGPTLTGEALKVLCDQVKKEVKLSTHEQKGDWMPLLFVMTDGKPSDIKLYKDMAPKVRNNHFANIVACAAGMKAKTEPLKELTDKVYTLDNMDSATFRQFFVWVSNIINEGSKSISSTEDLVLPPPPAEVKVG